MYQTVDGGAILRVDGSTRKVLQFSHSLNHRLDQSLVNFSPEILSFTGKCRLAPLDWLQVGSRRLIASVKLG